MAINGYQILSIGIEGMIVQYTGDNNFTAQVSLDVPLDDDNDVLTGDALETFILANAPSQAAALAANPPDFSSVPLNVFTAATTPASTASSS